MQKIDKYDAEKSVIPKGLKKDMAFAIVDDSIR